MLTPIEKEALETHRRGDPIPRTPSGDRQNHLILVGLRTLLRAGEFVRDSIPAGARNKVRIKDDGSPTTDLEHRIEDHIRQCLSAFAQNAVLVGEETGGSMPAKGTAIALDPIDGTRAYLAETETHSTTLAVIRDGVPLLGMVSNPVTGEIAYAGANGHSRLLRLSLFGESDNSYELQDQGSPSATTLVNVHPSRRARVLVDVLYGAWVSGDIGMVRSPGGSPAWALVEAARGHFIYVNLWSNKPAEPYDLTAGTMIVRGAGGLVSDMSGNPIDAMNHSGPFIAGLGEEKVSSVCAILRAVVESSGSD
jgi:fructose-1,6-bisphosphatase/inositol monophosphatase family enzyme